jgi:hypothetical protein
MTRVPGYHPRRVAPFGDLGIAGCQRLPRAFRRVAASFLGRQRLGIHRAPISAASSAALAAPRSRRRPGVRSGPARASPGAVPRSPRDPTRSARVRCRFRCPPLLRPIPTARRNAPASRPRPAPPDRGRRAAGGSARRRLPGAEHSVGRARPGSRGRTGRRPGRDPVAPVRLSRCSGGAAGIRTPDLRRARAALSRLSYGPEPSPRRAAPSTS